MRIDPNRLSGPQYFGVACVVDARHTFSAIDERVRVGFLGDDMHPVHACPDCARRLDHLVLARPRHTLLS